MPTDSPVENHLRRKDIDGLRAIAVLAIVIFHINSNWIRGGYLGVDIFFVISGYLITAQIIAGLQSRTFSFLKFYELRVRRLLPALIPILAAVLFLGRHILMPIELDSLGNQVRAASLYISNFTIVESWTDYFGEKAGVNPLLHLWSLAVEEQFYLVWPALLALVYWIKPKLISAFLGAVVFASFAWASYLHHIDPLHAFYFLPSRCWELALGGALAFLERQRAAPFLERNFVSVTGLALIAFSLVAGDPHGRIEEWFILIPCIGTLLVIASKRKSIAEQKFFNLRILSGIGLISYPLYLLHWPFLTFYQLIDPHVVTLLEAILILIILITASALIYLLVELRAQIVFQKCPHLSCALLIFSLALVGFAGNRVQKRSSQTIVDGAYLVQHQLDSEPATDEGCLRYIAKSSKQAQFFHYCRLSQPNSEPTVALIGDSHANHLFPGISNLFSKDGENLINLGTFSCPPFANSKFHPKAREQSICLGTHQALLEFLSTHPKIKHVVISFFFEDLFLSWENFNRQYNPIARQEPGSPLAELRQLIQQLKDMGKSVSLIRDRGYLDQTISVCISREWDSMEIVEDCKVPRRPREWVDQLKDDFFRELRKSVCIFDSTPLFEDASFDALGKGNRLLYYDSHHLTDYGSNELASEFAKSPCFKEFRTLKSN